jgi:hypothetical protein
MLACRNSLFRITAIYLWRVTAKGSRGLTFILKPFCLRADIHIYIYIFGTSVLAREINQSTHSSLTLTVRTRPSLLPTTRLCSIDWTGLEASQHPNQQLVRWSGRLVWALGMSIVHGLILQSMRHSADSRKQLKSSSRTFSRPMMPQGVTLNARINANFPSKRLLLL